jgi:hypothetical protein
MADNREIAQGRDRKLISLAEDYEVRYWSDRFGVTREELERAIEAVGDRAELVEDYLKKNRRH